MILKQLKLVDFRQFYGDNDIHFAWEGEKNVTLIHGENGVGKTTILNSILWCLFERLNSDFERPNDLINYEAAREGKKTCRVELYFVHDKLDYLAQRHHVKEGKNSFRVYKIENYNFREMPLPEQFIGSILPPQMANYFFFHGEGISSISDRRSGETFRRAIRDILGFTFAEQAIDDLKKVKRGYSKKAEEIYKRNDAARKAAQAKSEAEDRLIKLQESIDTLDTNIAEEDARFDDLSQRLSASGNSDANRIEGDLRATVKRVADTQKALRDCHLERQNLISKYGWAVFGTELASKGLDFIDDSTLKGRIPSPYQEAFVRDLLEAQECICGRELHAGTAEYEAVVSLLEKANTAIINQRVMKARSAAAYMEGQAQAFLDEVNSVERKREELETRLRTEQEAEHSLQQELHEIDEEEIQRLSKAFDHCRKRRDELWTQHGKIQSDIEVARSQIETFKRELSKHGVHDGYLQRLNRYQELIDEMISRCQGRLQEVEESSRSVIAQTVNSILRKFSRKDYAIRVTEDFIFYLVRDDGQMVAKSSGENLLLNLAFVASLIDMAKMRENAQGDFLVPGTVAPFVIDAPFGELDETYKGATTAFLPGTARQMVLLLSSSHWKGTVDDAIKSSVGYEYLLVSERRAEQGEKPDDIIEIGGQQIAQSIYGAERDITSLRKIQ